MGQNEPPTWIKMEGFIPKSAVQNGTPPGADAPRLTAVEQQWLVASQGGGATDQP